VHTTVRNDDVIMTSLKMPFSQEEKEFRIHSASCPPNSLDLNQVDYSVWGILQDKG